MKTIERQLDKLVQLESLNHNCVVCKKKKITKKAECYHHLIGRANPMTRYDPINLLPVCYDCHMDIHQGKVNDWDYVDKDREECLRELQRMSYKDFLIFVAKKTETEYLRELKEIWKSKL